MEEERVYNEMSSMHTNPTSVHRTRTLSSPVPAGMVAVAAAAVAGPNASTSRSLSPGLNYGEQQKLPGFTPPTIGTSARLHAALTTPPGVAGVPSPSPPPPPGPSRRSHPDAGRFPRAAAGAGLFPMMDRPPASPMDTSDTCSRPPPQTPPDPKK